METILSYFRTHFTSIAPPENVEIIDIVQILLIAVFVYYFMLWIKNTRAYNLLKGILFIALFLIAAAVTGMDTILWICKNFSTVVLVALVIIFQPELRRVLEQLGEKRFITDLLSFDNSKTANQRISDTSIDELVRAAFDMGDVKTGALIVLENDINLSEYEKTGIDIDGVITSQLLINIFEHNTPLHDGAVLIRNDRIQSATCYLPLTDNLSLNKNLGTRHRAAVGISEVSDAFTIVVSEETGRVSYTYKGKIRTNVAPNELREQLKLLQNNAVPKDGEKKRRIWKGRDDRGKTSEK